MLRNYNQYLKSRGPFILKAPVPFRFSRNRSIARKATKRNGIFSPGQDSGVIDPQSGQYIVID